MSKLEENNQTETKDEDRVILDDKARENIASFIAQILSKNSDINNISDCDTDSNTESEDD